MNVKICPMCRRVFENRVCTFCGLYLYEANRSPVAGVCTKCYIDIAKPELDPKAELTKFWYREFKKSEEEKSELRRKNLKLRKKFDKLRRRLKNAGNS